jgi:hypothetical protein
MKDSRRFWVLAAGLLAVAALGVTAWLFSQPANEGEPGSFSPLSQRTARDYSGLENASKRMWHGGASGHGAQPGRPTFQFDRKGVKVDSWVEEVRALRGTSLTLRERDATMAFLAGAQTPEGMSKGSMQWLSDELLTTLRLQQPSWKGLAAALAEAAFQPTTDPVVRDYIMQHLGHWWEQNGVQPEIEATLWRGVETADLTTPGTALIALNNGFQREQREDDLTRVRAKALELAENPSASLAVRSTALSIAAEGGGAEAMKLVTRLAGEETTPVILRKVAEHALRGK